LKYTDRNSIQATEAPEQSSGSILTPSTDVYLMGRTMLRVFAGIATVGMDTKDRLMEGYGDIPDSLKKLIIRCDNEDPSKRPAMPELLRHSSTQQHSNFSRRNLPVAGLRSFSPDKQVR
jgi:serine/threonine protein kinase